MGGTCLRVFSTLAGTDAVLLFDVVIDPAVALRGGFVHGWSEPGAPDPDALLELFYHPHIEQLSDSIVSIRTLIALAPHSACQIRAGDRFIIGDDI